MNSDTSGATASCSDEERLETMTLETAQPQATCTMRPVLTIAALVALALTSGMCAQQQQDLVDGQGIGVEFLDLDPLDRARIQAFVEQHQTPDSSGD